MATSSVSHRIIRIPYQDVGPALRVRNEILDKLRTLAASNILTTVSTPVAGLSSIPILQIECTLTSANDTTFVTSFAGWAALLGVSLLDTTVVTATAGH
jgi:hypothetical protein